MVKYFYNAKNKINRQFRRNCTWITPNNLRRGAVRGRRIPTSAMNSVGVQPASGLMGRGGGSITPSCPPAGVARGYPCMSPFGDGDECYLSKSFKERIIYKKII